MTLTLSNTTKRARIVHQFVGPIQRVQLRHVPTDWVLLSRGKGLDLAASVAELRGLAMRQGYVVDEGLTVEDWRPITEKMMRS